MADGLTRRCSYDNSFEYVDFTDASGFSNQSRIGRLISEEISSNSRSQPLTRKDFNNFFDTDGRLVDEHLLRKTIFKGGVDPEVRPDVWRFLYGLYPLTSTKRERQLLLAESYLKYEALKQRWKSILAQSGDPEAESLIHARWSESEGGGSNDVVQRVSPVSALAQTSEGKQQLEFMKIQAEVYAGRQEYDLNDLKGSIRVIDKDVPRTDKELDYFKGENNPMMFVLRDILVTFAAFHPKVGYAQGMNDILSRMMIVLDSEVEAFWCFTWYIEEIQLDFIAEGMVRKLSLLRQLLEKLDPDLYNYLGICGVDDLTFCHRWLILGFKREFGFEDGVKLFEILSSHYLELHSLEAETQKRLQRRKNFEQEGGHLRSVDDVSDQEYTFDLFVAVSIMMDHRDKMFRCTDAATVFQCIARLSMNIDVNDILCKSEAVFLSYCRKSVHDCFQVI
ncbi:PREDICTED: TBC1 domain family member 25-like isoform X2 [Priapulus caudatus]|nr:PREDICTED: TBC1 domain family member 25-like isoform X2 [Priapulus caudatus]